jgi:hypothetical protein
MKDAEYIKQREKTKANDAAHEHMMCWYAQQLGVTRAAVKSKLEYISPKQGELLHTKYQEHLANESS